MFFLSLFQAKVHRVVVEGVGRTKDDIIIKEVKPLLDSTTFQEVSHMLTFYHVCSCVCILHQHDQIFAGVC